jgi:hypothetical protein
VVQQRRWPQVGVDTRARSENVGVGRRLHAPIITARPFVIALRT